MNKVKSQQQQQHQRKKAQKKRKHFEHVECINPSHLINNNTKWSNRARSYCLMACDWNRAFFSHQTNRYE